MDKRFMMWWLVVTIQAVLVGIAINFSAISFIIKNDITYLSFLIIALLVIGTVMIGYITYKKQNNFDYTWFIAESAMTIGMIGTVIGFMLMLGSSFANIDPGNIDSMRKVIADMAVGMSTALLTTLTGLVVSLALKVQIIVSESFK
jgi:hypothetical protein